MATFQLPVHVPQRLFCPFTRHLCWVCSLVWILSLFNFSGLPLITQSAFLEVLQPFGVDCQQVRATRK